MTTALATLDKLETRLAPSTVDEMILAFLASTRSENTFAAYRTDLKCWLAWATSVGLDPAHAGRWGRSVMELYRRELEARGMAPSTVARRLSTVSSFYRYGQAEGVFERNPASLMARPRLDGESPRLGLSADEAKRLLEVCGAPQERALVSLLLFNALRVSEAVGADVEDLSAERGHRTLRIKGKGQVRKGVLIPLPPIVSSAIDDHLAGREQGPLFVNLSGDRMSRFGVFARLRRLARAADIAKTISPHSLRHTAVTLALDAGVPLRDVQILARHKSSTTTLKYDRHRQDLDRHASYSLAAYLA
ncbi:MAG: tyrosine-type recombinase/integrase [Actinomycetota bacterium]